ncbi:hypothetical protein J2M53_13935 [Arthrobacter sp. zg-ZUI100]|uniref:hypothetical protein n=1 Tax=Arthrobacter jiangjiafuii TaxID=2817475 RepID=UPI001AEE92FC|nr:hypothetical protein [Arthrobacter jiangjiafuii]MBP3037345.1 hypothetical protein [Arthrobacter jiangjiafuii]
MVPLLTGLGIGVWGIVASQQPPPDPLVQCRERHPEADGVPKADAEQGQEGGAGAYTVQGCAQPGIPGAADDGLWQVKVATHRIPDTSLLDPYNQVEVFSTDCPALGLSYFWSKMDRTNKTRHVVQDGTTVSGHDGSSVSVAGHGIPTEVQDQALSGKYLTVLNNSRNELESVSCEPMTAVAPADSSS